MKLTTNKVVIVIGLHHGQGDVRGVMEFCFSLVISRIEDSRGLTSIDFTEKSWSSMVHDKEFQAGIILRMEIYIKM
jgi:hypothetical protein